MKMSEKPKKKILIMGLDNVGKTCIVYCLKGIKNLMSFVRLNPTRGINIDTFEALGAEYTVWDFGGQEQFRDTHIMNLENHIIGADKIIYVIDVQNPERFELALQFLKKIVDTMQEGNHKVPFSVFLHKWDPDLNVMKRSIDEDKVNLLIQNVKDLIPKDLPYKFQKTSIYTVFEKSDIP